MHLIKIKHFMIINPCTLLPDDTVEKARILHLNTKYRAIPVLNERYKVMGILSKEALLDKELKDTTPVKTIMTSPVPTLFEDDLLGLIKQEKYRGLPIIPVVGFHGGLVGIISDPEILFFGYEDIIAGLTGVFGNTIEDDEAYGINVIDEDGQIVSFNRRAQKILGIQAKEVYKLHINTVLHESRLSEVVKKGKPHLRATMTAGNNITLCTNRFPISDGEKIIGAFGIFQDVTEEEKLKSNVHHLRSLNIELIGVLESITDGIVVLDEVGKVVKINSAFEKLTGISAIKCLGSEIDTIPELGNIPKFVFREILLKKRTFHFIECINDREILVYGNFMLDGDGKLAKIVVTLKDLNQLNEIIMNFQVAKEMTARYYSELENINNKIIQEDMIASSGAMKRVVNLALRVAQVDSSVLIMGETGVGKEVLARAIHKCSRRMEEAFVKLNCGAIPENLMESELFGYESGAFTGAKREGKPGLIEMADGGTLFLDEIADLPMNLQVKLLRVLQEREIQRVGGVKVKKVDFRLIAATNRNLEEMVKQKKFREDLFYRLNVVPVVVPPLRERREDIVPLIIFYLNKFNNKYGMVKKMAPEVIQSLLKYDWPGNVRELENTVERLIVTSDTNLIMPDNLTDNTRIAVSSGNGDAILDLRQVLEQTEKQLLLQAAEQCKTTRDMAITLGVSQSAVVKKMQKHGITKLKPE